MKTALALTTAALFASNALAVDALFEGFEGTPGYSISTPEFTDGSTDFLLATDGSNIAGSYDVAGFSGSKFFAAMDIDDGGTRPAVAVLDFTGVNIIGLTDLEFEILIAEDDEGNNQDWDSDTSFLVEYQVDGGGFQNLLAVEATGTGSNITPSIDTDFDGLGDGTIITDTFQQFTRNIAETGSLLDLRLTLTGLTAGDEGR